MQSQFELLFSLSDLEQATRAEKQNILDHTVSGLLSEDKLTGLALQVLGKSLIRPSDRLIAAPTGAFDFKKTSMSYGALAPYETIGFLTEAPRLGGFSRAIKRWPSQNEGILDVGCGPIPVLSLVAAHLHPESNVTAIEVNQTSAECAARVVDLFGLKDRITVECLDFADYKVPEDINAAVTETFNTGLSVEPWPRIIHALAETGVGTITPSIASLELTILDVLAGEAKTDMRDSSYAEIIVRDFDHSSVPPSPGPIGISASYEDDRGIVVAPGEDQITYPMRLPLGTALELVDLVNSDTSFNLAYELGVIRPSFYIELL